MSDLAPMPPGERMVSLDILRGFALCGVLIGNMTLYSGQWAEPRPTPDPAALDRIADWFAVIFVDSKAQTLLTLLFGFGFAMQLLRAERRGEPVMGLYVRRLVALLVLGALHVTVLWWGDVTWTYAVAGFGLLGFARTSNRTRVAWAIGLIFVPYLIVSIPGVVLAGLRVFMEPQEFAAHTRQISLALHGPERSGLAWQHLQYALVWCARIYLWYFLWVLGRFLLGYVAGRLRWFERDGAEHLAVFRRLAAWGAATGAVTSTIQVLGRTGLPALRDYGVVGRLVAATVEQIGLLAMTFMYVGIVVLLVQRPAWRRVLALVAPAGRMPLTTYFSQSLICTFLFYGWGLGWAGSVGTAGCIGLSLAIFGVQVAVAQLWLRWFRFGPLEWLWRTVVYLKPQPMRAR